MKLVGTISNLRRQTAFGHRLSLPLLVACSFATLAVAAAATSASAQDLGAGHANLASDAVSTPAVVAGPDLGAPFMYGASTSFASRWHASYGLALADETSLTSAFLKFDDLLATSNLSDRNSRDNWRHFLGLHFDAGDGFSLQGGVAKSSGWTGAKGASLYPTGYERLRLSTGARWKGKAWALDSSFSYIPTGATRVPGDAGFVPGMGGSGPTWLFSISVIRTF